MKSLRSTLSKSSTSVGNLAGKVALDFETQTTSGPIKFHDWTEDTWVILFSCQGAYTPDEILDIGRRATDLERRNIKVLGISTSGLDSHRNWVNSGWSENETTLQIASDADKRICAAYDLLGEEAVPKSSKTSRNTVVVVDPQRTIRLTLTYPASVARNFEEILKTIDAPEAMRTGNCTNPDGNNASGKGGVPSESPLSCQAIIVGEGVEGHLPSGGDNKSSFERVFGVVSTVSAIAEPMWTSPYLANAMQVLEQVADLGRTLPFVAPAFLLFKIIIELEQRAKDVDIKCRDLVERIIFMLGHLSALKTLEVAESTRHVVERMNNALKDAAALIEAYRRQRPLARRLSLNNRQKFEECALTLKGCTDDLLISLQIHQSGQLGILTRAIPVDPEDQAAQSFLDTHGNLENLRHHPELISEFAQQQHLVMDEQVMEELNSNISDVIQQNHARLEHILKDNVSASLIDGMKALAQQMDQVKMEPKLTCIQCGKEYRNSTNGPNSCGFHKVEYSSRSKSHACCGSSSPCEFKFHRPKHHCEYPYGTFFKYARELAFFDTKEKWAEAEDTDFEKNEKQNAFIARLYRWVSQGERITEPTIIIKVGSVRQSTPYYLDTFTSKELVVIANIVSLTGQTLIYRTSKENSEFAMAEWILSNATISGVRLSAKAATSSAPFILECPIDITTCTKSDDVRTISKGGFRSYNPNRPYELPKTVRSGPELRDKPIRKTHKDFKTRTTAMFPVILIPMSNPPLKAQDGEREHDNFQGEISIFNNHPAGSQNSITIASITGAYRFVGDEDYQQLRIHVINSNALPVTIEPRRSWNLQFYTWIRRSQEDIDLNMVNMARPLYRALLARHRPLRLKLTVQDISGEECSIVMEYVFEPPVAETKREGDLDYFYIDNPETYDRKGIHIQKATSDNHIMSIESDITVDQLNKITYNALKTGETEIDLKIGRETRAWEWKAWGLVDLSCCRVYAIKVLLTEGKLAKTKHSACLGYVPVPEYGDMTDEIRPIQYAVETVKFPELEPYVAKVYPTNDTFDDFAPELPKLAGDVPASGGPSQVVLSEELSNRLASIDTNLSHINTHLSRIATALELLAAKTN